MYYDTIALILSKYGTLIGETQPPPREGARSPLFSNLSKSGLDNYAVRHSERSLQKKVA